jgi:hypothetical protein
MDAQVDKIVTDIVEERCVQLVRELALKDEGSFTADDHETFSKSVIRLCGIYDCGQENVMQRLGIWK